MSEVLISTSDTAAPIHALDEAATTAFLETAPPFLVGLAAQAQFKGKAGQLLVVPGETGAVGEVLSGLGTATVVDPMTFRALPARLPAGDYRLALSPAHVEPAAVALAWALGAYRFDRYK